MLCALVSPTGVLRAKQVPNMVKNGRGSKNPFSLISQQLLLPWWWREHHGIISLHLYMPYLFNKHINMYIVVIPNSDRV